MVELEEQDTKLRFENILKTEKSDELKTLNDKMKHENASLLETKTRLEIEIEELQQKLTIAEQMGTRRKTRTSEKLYTKTYLCYRVFFFASH